MTDNPDRQLTGLTLEIAALIAAATLILGIGFLMAFFIHDLIGMDGNLGRAAIMIPTGAVGIVAVMMLRQRL